MNPKSLIWIGMIAGSMAGGFIPMLWGDDFLSLSSVIFSAVGGAVGIWAGFKMSG